MMFLVLLCTAVAAGVHGAPSAYLLTPARSLDYRLSFAPYEETFAQFKRDFARYYENEAEELHRFRVFLDSLKTIEEHNLKYHQGNSTFYLGINQFADMTHEEYQKHNRLGKFSKPRSTYSYCDLFGSSSQKAPPAMDWRQKNAVTAVKNQGQCGSCWTFSTTGSIEGSNAINTGRLLSFSEQQIVDCCSAYYCQGCNGGLMDAAFAYINSTGGLELESDYPYKAQDGACNFVPNSVKVKVTGCFDIQPGAEDDLLNAAAFRGPVAVAIDANHSSFRLYSGGVYYEENCSSDQLDHGVLVAGFGTESGSDYWLVKNSWGTDWGMDGYIKMARNKNNNCGISTSASFPLTSKA